MRADFHMHTCLSPCAAPEMTPAAVAQAARKAGLDWVAITDHNTARHAPAFAEACRTEGLHALFGLEVCTVEGAHVLSLFETPEIALRFGKFIFSRLNKIPLVAERMGDQPVMNTRGKIEERIEYYLGSATDLSVAALCEAVHRAHGLCIPSHVDRPAMSLMSQLGGIPNLPFDAIEVTARYSVAADPAGVRGRWAMLRSSDAHCLEQIGRGWTELDTRDVRLPALRVTLERLRHQQAAPPTTMP